MKKMIYGLTRETLLALMTEWGEPEYRARQVWHWLYVRRADTWRLMSNLPGALRDRLEAHCELNAVTERQRCLDKDDTGKLLLELNDGATVETAVIPAGTRRTVCVSAQVGCRYGCVFCASGQSGFKRDLQAGEMVGQVLAAARVFGAAPTHLVFMGIGEPLDNPAALETTIAIINDHEGLAIGARRITVSTCGLVPGIRRFTRFPLQVELSVSLHAPDDDLRSRLMPVNRKYPIAELLAACRVFFAATGRLITFEYTLIGGVNDSVTQARALVRRLREFPARINLIPLSPVAEYDGKLSTATAQRRFMDVLQAAGINVTLRVARGAGVTAACGQLRSVSEKCAASGRS